MPLCAPTQPGACWRLSCLASISRDREAECGCCNGLVNGQDECFVATAQLGAVRDVPLAWAGPCRGKIMDQATLRRRDERNMPWPSLGIKDVGPQKKRPAH